MNDDIVRVFVGCGPEHWLAYKVLEYSIAATAEDSVEILPLLEVEKLHPIPKRWKQRAPTSFSFQRFLIPAACQYQGKGIYLDSDQIVLHDIRDLWDTEFPEGADVLTTGGWQSAVMLIDCESARWDIEELCRRLDAGEFSYSKLSNLRVPICTVAGALDPMWNCIDRPDPHSLCPQGAKLLHYTDMRLQPWLRKGHPVEGKWLDALHAAIRAEWITADDVMSEISKGHVRPSLALEIGRAAPYYDAQFVYPDDKRKQR